MLVLMAWAPRADAFVYWSNDPANNGSTIGRANLDGASANQSFITGAGAPHDIAVDGSHIYWANQSSGTIGRANLDGTGVDESFITGASVPVGVAVDGAHVYWTNFNNGTGTTIGRANLDGSSVDQSFVTGASGPHSVAVDGAHIYWSNFGTGNGTTIGRADLDGNNASQTFISGASAPTGVAVDGVHVYWANFNAGTGTTIGRANLDGSSPDESFIGGAIVPVGLAVDATHIYWGNCGTGDCAGTTIGRANLDGTGIDNSFITGVSGPAGIAVDSLAPPPPAQALSVTLAGTGSGSVTGSGISCPGTCSHGFPAGTTVTLTATPVSGSTFSGWSGACTGTGACSVTMDADRAVTATFTASPAGARPACTLTPKSDRVAVRRSRRHKHGLIALTARCDQKVTGTVTGKLTEIVGARHGKRRTKVFSLATVHVALDAGIAKTVKMKVPAAAVLALIHHKSESARLTLAAGNANGTALAKATISPLKL